MCFRTYLFDVSASFKRERVSPNRNGYFSNNAGSQRRNSTSQDITSYFCPSGEVLWKIIHLRCARPGRKDIWCQQTVFSTFSAGLSLVYSCRQGDCGLNVSSGLHVCVGGFGTDPRTKLLWPWFQHATFRRKTKRAAKHNTDTDREWFLPHLWSVWNSYIRDAEQSSPNMQFHNLALCFILHHYFWFSRRGTIEMSLEIKRSHMSKIHFTDDFLQLQVSLATCGHGHKYNGNKSPIGIQMFRANIVIGRFGCFGSLYLASM